MVEDSVVHVARILSISIKEIDTPTREAPIKAQVYRSYGLVKVKYSFTLRGAQLTK